MFSSAADDHQAEGIIAHLMDHGKKKGTPYDFNLEDGQLKIDVTPLIQESEKEIREMLQGKNENEFIFGLLELMSGKAPTSSIWKKIK